MGKYMPWKTIPPYGWKESIATIELETKEQSEFIYLPCSDIEIEKLLMRLEASYLEDSKVNIDSYGLLGKAI